MEPTGQAPKTDRAQYAVNMTLAVVAGQVGCITLFLILLALIGGLWLDAQLNTRPLFTVVLMIASIPVTVIGMVWVVRKATSQIQNISSGKPAQIQEDGNSGDQ